MAEVGDENELLDYEEEETETPAEAQATKDLAKKDVKGTYVSIHSSGFRDFLLKPELLRAIVDCGFEHPSEGTRTDLCLFQVLKSKILSLLSCLCFLSFKCLYFFFVVASSGEIRSILKICWRFQLFKRKIFQIASCSSSFVFKSNFLNEILFKIK